MAPPTRVRVTCPPMDLHIRLDRPDIVQLMDPDGSIDDNGQAFELKPVASDPIAISDSQVSGWPGNRLPDITGTFRTISS